MPTIGVLLFPVKIFVIAAVETPAFFASAAFAARAFAIFPVTKYAFNHMLKRYANKAGGKEIRLYDLRHSHAGLLMEKGVNPFMSAQRPGHENIETTLNIYGRLYPAKESELIACPEDFHRVP